MSYIHTSRPLEVVFSFGQETYDCHPVHAVEINSILLYLSTFYLNFLLAFLVVVVPPAWGPSDAKNQSINQSKTPSTSCLEYMEADK